MPDRIRRERVEHEVEDDTGIVFAVERSKGGKLTVLVRVIGRILIDGETYGFDQEVRAKLTKEAES